MMQSTSSPTKSSSSSSSSVLIKGYLPIRLRLPSSIFTLSFNNNGNIVDNDDSNDNDYNTNQLNETIFYIKEHNDNNNNGTSSSTKKSSSSTLFIANVPIIPGIQTRLLLKSIFGRYGDIVRVTVIPNPRRSGSGNGKKDHQQEKGIYNDDDEDDYNNNHSNNSLQFWTKESSSSSKSFIPSYYLNKNYCTEGKFAHVVFKNHKEMKRAYNNLMNIMMMTSSSSGIGKKNKKKNYNDNETDDLLPALTIDKIEIQTLIDETDRQLQVEQKNRSREGNNSIMDDDDDDDDDDAFEEKKSLSSNKQTKSSGIIAIYERYLNSIPDRNELLEVCNDVMNEYEDVEQQQEERMKNNHNQPDEDGFITVSYATQYAGSKHELENDESRIVTTSGGGGRRTGFGSRSRSSSKKKKKNHYGGGELHDFYKFQIKDNRRKTLQELRTKFEQDIIRLQKLKEEKGLSSSSIRPF